MQGALTLRRKFFFFFNVKNSEKLVRLGVDNVATRLLELQIYATKVENFMQTQYVKTGLYSVYI